MCDDTNSERKINVNGKQIEQQRVERFVLQHYLNSDTRIGYETSFRGRVRYNNNISMSTDKQSNTVGFCEKRTQGAASVGPMSSARVWWIAWGC